MKAVFHPAASEEFLETAAYYEDQIPGLGERFVIEVERVTGVLTDQPEIGQIVGEIYRRIPLVRFPFSLIYSIEPDRIWIVAVARHSRLYGSIYGQIEPYKSLDRIRLSVTALAKQGLRQPALTGQLKRYAPQDLKFGEKN